MSSSLLAAREAVEAAADVSYRADVFTWFTSLGDKTITVVQYGVIVVGAVMAFVLLMKSRGGVAGPVGVLIGAVFLSWLISNAKDAPTIVDETVTAVNGGPAAGVQQSAPTPGWVESPPLEVSGV